MSSVSFAAHIRVGSHRLSRVSVSKNDVVRVHELFEGANVG